MARLAQPNQHTTRPGIGGVRAHHVQCKDWTNLTSMPPAPVLGRREEAVVDDHGDLHEGDNVLGVQVGAAPHLLHRWVNGLGTVENGLDGGPEQWPVLTTNVSAANYFECYMELFTNLRLIWNSDLYDNGNIALRVLLVFMKLDLQSCWITRTMAGCCHKHCHSERLLDGFIC